METNEFVRTNVVDYKLDATALDYDYQLILITIDDWKKVADVQKDVINLKPQSWITRKKNSQILVLLNRDINVPKGKMGITYEKLVFKDVLAGTDGRVYANHVFQLLLNQQSNNSYLESAPNLTSELIISLPKWEYSTKMNSYRYGVVARFSWESALMLSVRTYKQVSGKNNNDEYFYWNGEQHWMQRTFNKKEPVLYKKGSGSKNNNVDFMSITELRKFRESKVGISRDLLNSLRTNMKKYFEKVPEFKVFPLEDYTGKMKTLDDRFLWKYMAKQQLNIFYDNNVERARNIATNLARQLKASPTIQANQIQIKLSDHACPGLNIQIIQDDYGSEEDAYEISGEEKIIQHITVQKFHQFEDGHELSDITMDSKINKVAQELVIKQDLVSQTLTPVTGDLLDTTAKYEFYNFRYIKEKPLTIQVAKISFQTDRKFSIKSEQVVLENESQSELSVICHRVYHYVLNGPKRSAANKEYRWKTVAGVISSGEGLVAIQNVERQTLPDSEWLFDQLVTDNPEKQFDVRELGRVLKQLQCKHGVEDEYSELVGKIYAILKSTDQIFISIKMLNSSLKQNGISKRSNAFHELARDLTESTGFTLLNLIKQAPGRERLTNYYGAGLVRMEDGLYYYVGAEQPVKFKMDKANRLKRLIAIDEKLGVPQLIFRDMVKMMVVKFVRNGQYTVIPYPFKYLNEYLRHYSRMCTK